MAPALSTDEFQERLRSFWTERGFPVPEDSRIGISIAELVELSRQRNDQLQLPYVDLWVAILDEHISWFISIYYVVWTERNETLAATDFEKSVSLLLGKIIADMTAIRHLVIAGFDTSARTLLRSLSEYLEVLVALIHQPEFSDAFVVSGDSPGDAQNFWETHLRGGKIRRRVAAAWNDFFSASNSKGAAEWFANWGRGANPILAGLAHPSFAGGLFAIVPPKAKHTDENWLGIWGDKAESSVQTIFILLQHIFPVLVLGRNFPFGVSPPYLSAPFVYDEGKEMHRHVHIGRDVLTSLILSIGIDTNTPHFFPEIDMSIWQEADTVNGE
jgi:hypothetical protein